MAAIPLIAPVAAGTTVTATTPTASDTISIAVLGDAGCNLRVQTAGTGSTLTISDAGFTPAGGTPAAFTVVMSATQIKTIYISSKRADPTTGLVTIASTSQATMTYELYPA
jgi:hypothetical protein